MIEPKNMVLFIVIALCISGCAAGSKTVKPTATAAITPERAIQKESRITKKIGVTYSQVTNLIGEFLDIQATETASGKPMFLGQSEEKLVTLEIIGEKNNILEASMKLAYPEDIVAINADLNRAMLLRFLRNAAPEFGDWSAEVKEIINRFYSLQIDTKEESITLEQKIVQILYDKNKTCIVVTVRGK